MACVGVVNGALAPGFGVVCDLAILNDACTAAAVGAVMRHLYVPQDSCHWAELDGWQQIVHKLFRDSGVHDSQQTRPLLRVDFLLHWVLPCVPEEQGARGSTRVRRVMTCVGADCTIHAPYCRHMPRLTREAVRLASHIV